MPPDRSDNVPLVAATNGDGEHKKQPQDQQQQQQMSATAYVLAIAALSLCLATHSWLLISVFPYSGFMAIHLIPSLDEETAGSYAGLIASAFMVGRAITSYSWGKIADRYGRKFVLIFSLVTSMIFSLLFGLSPTFGCALVWRFLLGFVNGIVGTSKTTTSEIAYGNEIRETRGMGIVMGMWGWGFLFSPVLSGILAEPAKQYPNSKLVQSIPILAKYPFILPNLMSVLFCALAIAGIVMFVPETLPAEKVEGPNRIPGHIFEWLKSILVRKEESSSEDEARSLVADAASYGTGDVISKCTTNEGHGEVDEDCEKLAKMSHAESCSMLSTASPHRSSDAQYTVSVVDVDGMPELPEIAPDQPPEQATMTSLWSQSDTRTYLLVYWIYSFVGVAIDEGFPLFCISHQAGLALSESSIGKILSGSGLIYAVCQYFVYSAIVERFGVEGSICIGAWTSGPLMFLVPISVWLNKDSESSANSMTWSAYAFLCLLFAIYRIFSSVFYSSVTVATNRTVRPSHRATMNGLSMLGGSFAKGLGPTFAGILVSFCLSSGLFPPKVGGILIWSTIGMAGIGTGVMSILAVRKQLRP